MTQNGAKTRAPGYTYYQRRRMNGPSPLIVGRKLSGPAFDKSATIRFPVPASDICFIRRWSRLGRQTVHPTQFGLNIESVSFNICKKPSAKRS